MKSPQIPQYDRIVGIKDFIGELPEMLSTTDATIIHREKKNWAIVIEIK